MNVLLKIFVLMSLVLTGTATAQSWRSIVLMQSARSDVEKLLGPNKSDSAGVVYECEDATISVIYSTGPCTKERKGGWNVGKDVVVSMGVSHKTPLRFKDLKLGKKYKKKRDPWLEDVLYYSNAQSGVIYEVQYGYVIYIYYNPPAKYKHLYCKD